TSMRVSPHDAHVIYGAMRADSFVAPECDGSIRLRAGFHMIGSHKSVRRSIARACLVIIHGPFRLGSFTPISNEQGIRRGALGREPHRGSNDLMPNARSYGRILVFPEDLTLDELAPPSTDRRPKSGKWNLFAKILDEYCEPWPTAHRLGTLDSTLVERKLVPYVSAIDHDAQVHVSIVVLGKFGTAERNEALLLGRKFTQGIKPSQSGFRSL